MSRKRSRPPARPGDLDDASRRSAGSPSNHSNNQSAQEESRSFSSNGFKSPAQHLLEAQRGFAGATSIEAADNVFVAHAAALARRNADRVIAIAAVTPSATIAAIRNTLMAVFDELVMLLNESAARRGIAHFPVHARVLSAVSVAFVDQVERHFGTSLDLDCASRITAIGDRTSPSRLDP